MVECRQSCGLQQGHMPCCGQAHGTQQPLLMHVASNHNRTPLIHLALQ